MEPVLRELVHREGFEAVFTALKGIVMAEYERANRDYQFLLKITGEDKKKETNSIEPPVLKDTVQADTVQADSKTVEIAPAGTKKIYRKKSHNA